MNSAAARASAHESLQALPRERSYIGSRRVNCEWIDGSELSHYV